MTMNDEWQDKRIIMTPKQREILVNLHEQFCRLESYLGTLLCQVDGLPEHFDSFQDKEDEVLEFPKHGFSCEGEFTEEDTNEWLYFSNRLAASELYDTLKRLHREIYYAKDYYGVVRRQLHNLPKHFDSAQDNSEFSTDEINELLRLNHRLAELELYLCDLSEKECAYLADRVSDTNDALDDYEIDATLYFTLREDDPEFDENEDNVLARRKMSLKRLDREWGLGDGQDHRVSALSFPGGLNEASHCWLFHDLYDHHYGLEQPALTLQDCLRVRSIWVDVAVRHQATLAIKSGKWQKY